MNLISSVKPITANFIAGPLTGNWQLIDTLSAPAFCIRIQNDTDDVIDISYDGVLPGDYIMAHDKLQLYCQANAQSNYIKCNMAEGQKIWIRGTGNGNVYFSGYTSYR